MPLSRILAVAILALATGQSFGADAEGVEQDWNQTLAVEVGSRNWQAIVVHHSATTRGTVEGIHRHHRDVNGWDGIGYHFVIGNGDGIADGRVESTYRWREQRTGAHAGHRGFNEFGIGVCLIGHFDRREPTPAQLRSLKQLQIELARRFSLAESRLIPHGRIKGTACPGRFFPTSLLLPAETELPAIAATTAASPPGDAVAGHVTPSCDDVPRLVRRPADRQSPWMDPHR